MVPAAEDVELPPETALRDEDRGEDGHAVLEGVSHLTPAARATPDATGPGAAFTAVADPSMDEEDAKSEG